MNEIILVGAGGHAQSCIDVIELSGKFKIAGLVVRDNKEIKNDLNYPIIGTDDDLEQLRKTFNYAIITVGQIKSIDTRILLYEKLINLDYVLPVIYSPRSHLSKSCKIYQGTIIMHDVIVNANATIGNNCIINNKALIEHEAEVGDHTHISTGAIINGGVKVENQCFIGSGVITKQSISIGNNCIIGAGEVLKKNIKPRTLVKSDN